MLDGSVKCCHPSWKALGRLPSLRPLELESATVRNAPNFISTLTGLTALSLRNNRLGGTRPLTSLAALPRLARLELTSGCLLGPSSGLPALITLRSLRDERCPGARNGRCCDGAAAGAHLAALQRYELCVCLHSCSYFCRDFNELFVEPLRAATALTSLALEAGCVDAPGDLPDDLSFTRARITALLAGKPLLRELEIDAAGADEGALELEALRAAHLAVAITLRGGEFREYHPLREYWEVERNKCVDLDASDSE